MKLREAILKSLDEINGTADPKAVHQCIVEKKYFDFGDTKSPTASVSKQLGEFIRLEDNRVKRNKEPGGSYSYYLTKNEQNINFDALNQTTETEAKKTEKVKTYNEKNLHKLLSSYLKSTGVYSKTISHEQSNGKDNTQIWTHPDMIGIQFLDLQNKASQNFRKAINPVATFKMSSYELKKGINSDSELKMAFFQAVSNSSWANNGYLVAFEFASYLIEEMERLNQSFGIGVIELKANPYQSKVLFHSKARDLDFKTIDKLCKNNPVFEKFIIQVETLRNAGEQYHESKRKEFDEYCDDYFTSDTDVEEYCKNNHIPI